MTRVPSTTGRSTAIRLLGAGLVAALAITACSGDDGDESDSEAAPDTQNEPADDGSSPEPGGEPDDAAGDAADGEVPDPCSLISQAELTRLLGGDPGNGESDAVMPDQRKVCMFIEADAMVTLGIELASHYEESVGMFGEQASQAVEGVGREAVWFDMGLAGTLIALGDDYFVDITVGPDQQDAAKAIAETMLAAA